MKNLKTITLSLFCVLMLGLGQLSAPVTASAAPSQVRVGVGLRVAPHYRHHRRRRPRHHRKPGVVLGVHIR
jgi:hypothetical protein